MCVNSKHYKSKRLTIATLVVWTSLLMGCAFPDAVQSLEVAEAKPPRKTVAEDQIVVLVPTSTSTATMMPAASQTPTQPTATPTGVPTKMNTATPGYTPTVTLTPDFGPMSWATQEVPGSCPGRGDVDEPLLTDPFEDPDAMIEELVSYLNNGGTIQQAAKLLAQMGYTSIVDTVDVTNDGVDEVIIRYPLVAIFACADGHYGEIFRLYPGENIFSPVEVGVRDLNRNGVRDIVVVSEWWGAHNYTMDVQVFEWNGESIVNRMAQDINHPYQEMGRLYGYGGSASMFNGYLRMEDVDSNGTIELLLSGGAEGGLMANMSAPQLWETHTWMWNGSVYTFVDVTFSEPMYKYQAVVAADLYSQMDQYDRALELYNRAIYDDSLDAWNAVWNEYGAMGGGFDVYPTKPPQDYEQGERIKAYARFRIMVLKYLSGEDMAAEQQYQSNLQIHDESNAGHAYAELATVFREAYLKNSSIQDGCRAVQGYAELHEEKVLWPLGSGVYGESNPSYHPEDLCPFN
jgi:tetratricopeptide (TPR) repeat protein